MASLEGLEPPIPVPKTGVLPITLQTNRVTDEAWTRDLLNHNQTFYQLNYSHHRGYFCLKTEQPQNRLNEVADVAGFEPATIWLTIKRSTPELHVQNI